MSKNKNIPVDRFLKDLCQTYDGYFLGDKSQLPQEEDRQGLYVVPRGGSRGGYQMLCYSDGTCKTQIVIDSVIREPQQYSGKLVKRLGLS